MKREWILCLGLAGGFAQCAVAEEPPVPSPQTLGMVEAIIAKCTEIDPANTERYRAEVQLVTQGTSVESVAKARKSDEYRHAYDSTVNSLSGVVAADAIKSCRASLPAR